MFFKNKKLEAKIAECIMVINSLSSATKELMERVDELERGGVKQKSVKLLGGYEDKKKVEVKEEKCI